MNDYRTVEDLPRTIPLFPLGGALLLRRGRVPRHIFEPRYLTWVDVALAQHRLIGMVQPREDTGAARPDLYSKGCVGRVTSFNETPDGRYMITLSGVCRFELKGELDTVTPYRQATVDFAPFLHDLSETDEDAQVPREHLLKILRAYLEKFGLQADWETIEQAPAETLVNSLGMICPFEWGEKQALLEAPTLKDRAQALVALLEMATVGLDDDDLPLQ